MKNALYLAAIAVTIGIGAHFAFDLERAGTPAFVLWMAIPTVAVAAIGVGRAYFEGTLKEWLRVKSGDFSRGFVAAAALFAGAWAYTKFVAPLGSARESWLARLYLQLGSPTMLKAKIGYVVLAIVVMAVAEEIVWRGLVTSLLAELIGPQRAWVWSAVVYALAHAATVWRLRDPVAGLNPVIPLAALFAGLVWGFMAQHLRRLWPGIFSHVLFDWAVLIMFRLWGPSV